MDFKTRYSQAQESIHPGEALLRRTLTATAEGKRPRRSWKRPAAVAAALILCLTLVPPVLATQSQTVYALLYYLSPAAAQLFQPVEKSCVSNGIRMEVVAVKVEGDSAQAYITLQDLEGDRVDATTDLFDSYSTRIPFDSTGHCERLGFDEATKTVTFLVTQQTMDGSPIPKGKMSFSLQCFLSGKEVAEGLSVPLSLADYAVEAPTTDQYESSSGGGRIENAKMLSPQGILSSPATGIDVTALGYADGYFHVQVELFDIMKTDNHCFLYLQNSAGEQLNCSANVYFREGTAENRQTYVDFFFDIPPEELADYTLYGDFYTANGYTEGDWRITFPLENQ